MRPSLALRKDVIKVIVNNKLRYLSKFDHQGFPTLNILELRVDFTFTLYCKPGGKLSHNNCQCVVMDVLVVLCDPKAVMKICVEPCVHISQPHLATHYTNKEF